MKNSGSLLDFLYSAFRRILDGAGGGEHIHFPTLVAFLMFSGYFCLHGLQHFRVGGIKATAFLYVLSVLMSKRKIGLMCRTVSIAAAGLMRPPCFLGVPRYLRWNGAAARKRSRCPR